MLKPAAEDSSFCVLSSQIQLTATIIGLCPFTCRWVHIHVPCPGRPRRGTHLRIRGSISADHLRPHNWGFHYPSLSHVTSLSNSPSKIRCSHRCILKLHYGIGKSLHGFGGMGRCLIVFRIHPGKIYCVAFSIFFCIRVYECVLMM
jgi:hypothetical protein